MVRMGRGAGLGRLGGSGATARHLKNVHLPSILAKKTNVDDFALSYHPSEDS